MIRSVISRFVLGISLFFASLAWSGWAYLHTVADPHRAEQIADAVLADPDARLELAQPLADQIVDFAGLDASVAPEIRDAVVGVMADPRIIANLTAAVGSAHAHSFGVPDPRPATIDGGALVAAVREHLSVASPALAARIPSDLVGQLKVPEHRLPFIAGIRTFAKVAMEWLGALAIGLFTFAFLVGDRSRALRRYGFWAISAGLVWALGPRLVVFLAHRFATSIDATLSAGVNAAARTMTFAATGLVLTGIAALVGSRLIKLLPARAPADRSSSVSPSQPLPRLRSNVRTVASEPMAVDAPSAFSPVIPTTVTPVIQAVPPVSVAPTTVTPVTAATPAIGLPTVPLLAGDLPLAAKPITEFDPWAQGAGPAVEPTTGEPLEPRPDPDTPGPAL